MDERDLRALQRAVQPILQRTAPAAAQARVKITPPLLDLIAWSIVLAYVANVSREPTPMIPRQAQTGEGALRDDEVRSALDGLKCADVGLRGAPQSQDLARFAAAARRLLEANGWAPQRAAQAADEVTAALRRASRRRSEA